MSHPMEEPDFSKDLHSTSHTDDSNDLAPIQTDKLRYGYWHLPGESKEMYEHLGVRVYKNWVPTTGDKMRQHFGFRAGGLIGSDRQSKLEHLIQQTKDLEVAHLGAFALVGVIHAGLVEIANTPSIPTNIIFGGIQLFGNVYPIMAQRYNRLRATRLLSRIKNPTE